MFFSHNNTEGAFFTLGFLLTRAAISFHNLFRTSGNRSDTAIGVPHSLYGSCPIREKGAKIRDLQSAKISVHKVPLLCGKNIDRLRHYNKICSIVKAISQSRVPNSKINVTCRKVVWGLARIFQRWGGGGGHTVKHYRRGSFATEYCRLFA